jgi:hypothetical protein
MASSASTTRSKSISFRYIPALVSAKEFAGMKIQILKVNTYVPLQELITAYSEGDKKIVHKRFVKPVKYNWYWEADFTFEMFDETVGNEIEEAYQSGHTVLMALGYYEYEINPAKMKQMNLTTRKERRIDRRPRRRITIRATDDILEKLETHSTHTIEYEVPSVQKCPGILEHMLKIARRDFAVAEKVAGRENIILVKGARDIVKKVEAQLNQEFIQWMRDAEKLTYPDYWEDQESNCVLRVVKQGSREWGDVEQCVMEPQFTMQIVRIERIQNRWLWEVYEQSKKRVSDKNGGQPNEMKLFHGTRKTPPVHIYNSEQGFDNRLSSSPGLWGEGAYFAVQASYSNNYAFTTPDGYKQMFMAMVITGITCKYDQHNDRTLKAPPINRSSRTLSSGVSMFENQRYDSVSGYTYGTEVFIIYEHGKAYPAYLITYT